MTGTTLKTRFSGHELSTKTAREIVGLLKAGEVSSEELIKISCTRMDQVEPTVNACPTRCDARAMDTARCENLGANVLAGMPIGIKDLSAVSGVKTTWGTEGYKSHIPDTSDPIVNRLEDHGAIVLAKTNTPEFGAGGNTFNAVFGATLNPWDTSKNAGGSSGGASASLATGEFWLAHGSDHAGSLRTPAAYCGIVGLRPSPGLVPSGGDLGYAREGVQGPMARNVEDCALLLDAMCGFDPTSPISFPSPGEAFSNTTPLVESRYKIAYAPTLGGFGPVETEIRDVLDAAMKTVAKDGAKIDDACPELGPLETTYRTLRGAMWAATVGRKPAHIQKHLKQTLAENIDFGRALKIENINDAELGRTVIFKNMARFFDSHDVLATAVVGCAPKAIEIEYPTEVAGEPMDDYLSWLKFAFLATTTGLPAMSIPVGFTSQGLPVGLQLIGPNRGEAKLLQIANFIEKSLMLDLSPIDPMS